ncbi:MAG TPA: hypothetical protein VNK46_00320 [Nitrospiraceae bacterium]|nr:hypothetical protein [Nitrospiraceae bacterium]
MKLWPFDYEVLSIDATTGGVRPDQTKVAQCDEAEVTFEAGPVRYRIDGGAPTSNDGHQAFDGERRTFTQRELVNLRLIRAGTTNGTARITYRRRRP